jgi:hypothetical protein
MWVSYLSAAFISNIFFHTDDHTASCAQNVRRTECNLPIPYEAAELIKPRPKHILGQVEWFNNMNVWKQRVWLINKAFKEFNRKSTFGPPTPFSPWFSSKAVTKIWRVGDFTGYNNDIVFSVADKVEEWVIGHEREESGSSGWIPHWNKTIY